MAAWYRAAACGIRVGCSTSLTGLGAVLDGEAGRGAGMAGVLAG